MREFISWSLKDAGWTELRCYFLYYFQFSLSTLLFYFIVKINFREFFEDQFQHFVSVAALWRHMGKSRTYLSPQPVVSCGNFSSTFSLKDINLNVTYSRPVWHWRRNGLQQNQSFWGTQTPPIILPLWYYNVWPYWLHIISIHTHLSIQFQALTIDLSWSSTILLSLHWRKLFLVSCQSPPPLQRDL